MLFLLSHHVFGNFSGRSTKWIETKYKISTTQDLVYAEVLDFAGNRRSLKLDLSLPTDDQPPACGRPLLILIHGGAFLAGSKSDGLLANGRQDFAKEVMLPPQWITDWACLIRISRCIVM